MTKVKVIALRLWVGLAWPIAHTGPGCVNLCLRGICAQRGTGDMRFLHLFPECHEGSGLTSSMVLSLLPTSCFFPLKDCCL